MQRVKAARSKAFAEEAARRGCSIEKVEAEADELVEKRRAQREACSVGADSEAHINNDARTKVDEEAGDDLPPLEVKCYLIQLASYVIAFLTFRDCSRVSRGLQVVVCLPRSSRMSCDLIVQRATHTHTLYTSL